MINWNKISANAGLAFFTTLAATLLTGDANYLISILNALIISGVAFCTELKTESEEIDRIQKRVATAVFIV